MNTYPFDSTNPKAVLHQSSMNLPTDHIHIPALDTQVGGDHYKKFPIQPVQFCEKNNLPYCLANIIKYVVRHAAKHGKQDLEKAQHYADLGMSMYGETRKFWKEGRDDEWVIIPSVFIAANKFTGPTAEAINHACSVFGAAGMLGYLRAKHAIQKIIVEEYC